MAQRYLYLVVFVAGAAVLAIEILGTVSWAPSTGVSLFLWSALITVTLVALSLGYAIGGRWADRGAAMSRLNGLLVAAGALTLTIPWLKQPILAIAEPFGLRFAVLVAAFLLFAAPLTLLGMGARRTLPVRSLPGPPGRAPRLSCAPRARRHSAPSFLTRTWPEAGVPCTTTASWVRSSHCCSPFCRLPPRPPARVTTSCRSRRPPGPCRTGSR